MTDIRIKNFDSIHKIEPDIWDGLTESDSFFHSHRFIRTVEEAAVEHAEFEYLLFYKDDRNVGNAVISVFNFTPDLFITQTALSSVLHRLFPSMSEISLLAGGLPASFGQLNMYTDAEYTKETAEALANILESRAQKCNAKFMAVKELNKKEANQYEVLTNYGFIKAISIPQMFLDIRWSTFGKYLESMRHSYRRNIQQSLKKLGLTNPVIYRQDEERIPADRPVLVLGNTHLCTPDYFHELYLRVMERSQVKLEVLNEAFFHRLYHNCSDDLELMVLRKGTRIISAAILVREGGVMTFMLVGRRKEKDDYDSYFNLVYGIVAHAINCGVGRLNLGQTSYWVKQRIGGKAEERYFYIKSNHPWLQYPMKKLNKIIFPTTQLKEIRVFHLN